MRIYEFPLVSKASDDLWTDLAAWNRFSCSNEKTNYPVQNSPVIFLLKGH